MCGISVWEPSRWVGGGGCVGDGYYDTAAPAPAAGTGANAGLIVGKEEDGDDEMILLVECWVMLWRRVVMELQRRSLALSVFSNIRSSSSSAEEGYTS